MKTPAIQLVWDLILPLALGLEVACLKYQLWGMRLYEISEGEGEDRGETGTKN